MNELHFLWTHWFRCLLTTERRTVKVRRLRVRRGWQKDGWLEFIPRCKQKKEWKRENAKGGESEKIVQLPLNHGLWLRGGARERERERGVYYSEGFPLRGARAVWTGGQQLIQLQDKLPKSPTAGDSRALPLFSLLLLTINVRRSSGRESLTSSSSPWSVSERGERRQRAMLTGSLCANEWGNSWWPGETFGSGGWNLFLWPDPL